MHDIVNNIGVEQPLMPQSILASAIDSGAIDTLGAETVAVAVLVGDIIDTLGASVRVDLKIEHADDDGTGNPAAYAACTDADVLNATGLVAGKFMSIDAGNKKQKRHLIGYRGGKRFICVTATPVGLVSGGTIAMLALKGNLSQLPVTNT